MVGELTLSRALFLALLAGVAALRFLELARSRRNETALRARVGRETGPGVFRAMVVLHTALFVAPVAEVFLLDRPFLPALGGAALGVVAAATALRYHAIRTLGATWSARAVVAPDMPVVCERGLYRWIRHPNYLGVLLEIPALPLVHTAWISAAALGLTNAVLVALRIRQEEAALFTIAEYRDKMAAKARLIPGVI